MSISRIGLLALFLLPEIATAGTVELISRAGTPPDSFGASSQPALSADGRYVAFLNDAPNLVPGQEDGSFTPDVFLHDRVTGSTTLVSHAAGSPTRTARPDGSYALADLAISADGRYVAFNSPGVDLVPGAVDDNESTDVFLWDRVTGTTTLVSHEAGSPGTTADGISYGLRISADGSFVAFTSTAGNLVAGQSEPGSSFETSDVFLWSRATNTSVLVSRKSGTAATGANGSSFVEDLSADGSVLVFTTAARDLLANVADANPDTDVYAYQRSSNTLSLVSRAANSAQTAVGAATGSASLSADGRYVAFASMADNLVPGQVEIRVSTLDAFVFDRVTGEMRLASHTSASPQAAGEISFAQRSPVISADGRYVAFTSLSTNLVPGQVDSDGSNDVFVYDRVTGTLALASHSRSSATTAGASGDPGGLGASADWPSFSADGRFLVFESTAVDLVSGQTDVPSTNDVFLYDRTSGNVTLVSRTGASASTTGNRPSGTPVISADGSVVAFTSEATDLGEGQVDPNLFRDLFLYRRSSGEITSPSRRDPGLPPRTSAGPSTLGSLSADGRFVLFLSPQAGDFNSDLSDVFLRDTVQGTVTRLSPPPIPPFMFTSSFAPVLSADGRFAAFVTIQWNQEILEPVYGLYLYDRTAGTLTLVNRQPGSVNQPDGTPVTLALSADGRFVAYECQACGLVPGHPASGQVNPGMPEIFLYDRVAGTNTLVSHPFNAPTGRADGASFDPKISADGRFVVFASHATNLVIGQTDAPETPDLFVFDRTTGVTSLISHIAGSATTAAGLTSSTAGLSADGRYIAFVSAAANEGPGVFLHDQVTGTTVLVSHAAAPDAMVSINADGRFLVYDSLATGAPNVFLYDRAAGTNTLVSHAHGAPLRAGNGESTTPRISADGSRIAFLSDARDLTAGPGPAGSRGLHVQDRSTGVTTFIGRALPGRPFEPDFPLLSLAPRLSANGRRIAFASDAALVPGDYNGTWDVYLWDESGTVDPGGPIPVPPCRLLDTRRRADRPILTSNVPRTVTAHGRCGVPATAKEVVVKVTVFNPSGKGNLRFYPGPVTANPSGILRFERSATRTQTLTLPLSPNGTLTILPFVASRGTVHGAVEVTAYEN